MPNARPTKVRSLTDLLDVLDHAAAGDTVSVQKVLDEIGERSFTPIILAIAVLLVSPISGIPGVPTISAMLMVLIGSQGLARRRHLWLPGFLTRREIAAERLRHGIGWLRKPAAWVDRHSHRRLSFLTEGPARAVAFLFCILIPLAWPPLEVLPMVTSIGAASVVLLAFGLLTHDGLYTLAGYLVMAAMITTVVVLI